MTIVAIHQPNFFPWVGYFEKIAYCDYFVFLDDVQYSKGTMINRTKIRGDTLITCPVHAPFPSKIKNVTIAHNRWKEKVFKTIFWNYKNCRYFNEYIPEIYKFLFNNEQNLSRYNISNIIAISGLLDIQPQCGFIIQSELQIPDRGGTTETLVDIIGYLGGTKYYSGIGAFSYLDEQKMRDDGISVLYQDISGFPKTSIIDVLMKRGKNIVGEMII